MKLGIKNLLTYYYALVLIACLMPNFVHASQYDTNFPDIINCKIHYTALGTTTVLFYYSTKDNENAWWGYGIDSRQYESLTGYGVNYLLYDKDGNFITWTASGGSDFIDCNTSISELFTSNKAFNFNSESNVIEEPAQTFFNGFILFLLFASWIIWIFRPKSN